jgi:hypothetical protein
MYRHGMYVFGGHHTMTTLVNLLNDQLAPPYDSAKKKPAIWSQWPSLIIALPDAFSDYVKYLDICSEFDNEPIALEPSFKDRILKLRTRWEQKFGSVRGYQDATKQGQGKKAWMEEMSLSLNLAGSEGKIGQWIQLVAHPRATWEKIKKILEGDYVTPKEDRQGKVQIVKGKPIKSTTYLFNLMGFDNARFNQILDQIISAQVTMEHISKVCKEVKVVLRCRTAIVTAYEEIGAVDPATGVAPTWEFLKENMPVVEELERPYNQYFSASNRIKDASVRTKSPTR